MAPATRRCHPYARKKAQGAEVRLTTGSWYPSCDSPNTSRRFALGESIACVVDDKPGVLRPGIVGEQRCMDIHTTTAMHGMNAPLPAPCKWPHRRATQFIGRCHPYARKSTSQAVDAAHLRATRRTPRGASRLMLVMSAWSVKYRHAPSRPGIVGMRGSVFIRLRPPW